MYKIVLLSDAEKFYKKLCESDRSIFDRISRVLNSLKEDPFQGKPLKYKLKGKYSLRVGAYRIIYQVERKIVTVYVLEIGHRSDIYR